MSTCVWDSVCCPLKYLLAIIVCVILGISGVLEMSVLITVQELWSPELQLSWVVPVLSSAAIFAFIACIFATSYVVFLLDDACWTPAIWAMVSILISMIFAFVFYGKKGESGAELKFLANDTVKFLYENIDKYDDDFNITLQWNKIHIKSDCCGYNSYDDWKSIAIPVSCCEGYTMEDLELAYTNGGYKNDQETGARGLTMEDVGYGGIFKRDTRTLAAESFKGDGRVRRSLVPNKTCNTNNIANLRKEGKGCFADLNVKMKEGIVALDSSVGVAVVLQVVAVVYFTLVSVKKQPDMYCHFMFACCDSFSHLSS